MDKKIEIGVANEGLARMDFATLKEWQPKRISKLSDTTIFEVDKKTYSMKTNDFIEIYGDIKNKR